MRICVIWDFRESYTLRQITRELARFSQETRVARRNSREEEECPEAENKEEGRAKESVGRNKEETLARSKAVEKQWTKTRARR